MNGILVVDKPQGFTSFDVVAKLRGICQMKKIGHGGTLDPMATGVLPVFLGHATKAMDLQPNQDKTYEAAVLFGVATDTGDITGEVLRRLPVNIKTAQLQAALPAFMGRQSQLPPMYSAVKIDGKPLYRYAREGKSVQRKSRGITIHELQYMGQQGENQHLLRVKCSKGTYIRTLAEDIGAALGAPATLQALRRTEAGVYTLAQAKTLEEIQAAKNAGALADLVRPVQEVFASLPLLGLPPAAALRLQNGAAVRGIKAQPGLYRADVGGHFLGLVQARENGEITIHKLFSPLPG